MSKDIEPSGSAADPLERFAELWWDDAPARGVAPAAVPALTEPVPTLVIRAERV